MGKKIINGIEYSGSGANNASELPYDDTVSTKEKIDELNTNISEINSKLPTFTLSGTTLTITTNS